MSQMSSGAFETIRSLSPELVDGRMRNSPFITTFVLHSLFQSSDKIYPKEMIGRAINYLLSELEHPATCRFFGKSSRIPPDMDDTCCTLACLKEFKVQSVDFEYMATYLLKFRNPSFLFYTWMNDNYANENDVDVVVNSNALFFYRLMNIDMESLTYYLLSVMKRVFLRNAQFNSLYYISPTIFLYTMLRAIIAVPLPWRPQRLQLRVLRLCNRILATNFSALHYLKRGSTMDKALSIAVFSDILAINRFLKKRAIVDSSLLHPLVGDLEILASYLINCQDENGSWEKKAMFVEPGIATHAPVYYGSSALTTGFCIEALSKYRNLLY